MSYECGKCELPPGMCECKWPRERKHVKNTDKMRLDWLQENSGHAYYCGGFAPNKYAARSGTGSYSVGLTIRRAIDAAIRAERRRERRK